LGILQPGQFQGSFGLVVGKSTRPSICPSSAPPPNHLVPVFSCEKALNIKNIKIKIKIEGLGLGCVDDSTATKSVVGIVAVISRISSIIFIIGLLQII
jgi:hypothetical protein